MSINFFYSCAFSFCALIILLIIFFKQFSSKNNKRKNFFALLISNILLLLFDIIYVYIIDKYGIHTIATEIFCRADSYLLLLTLVMFIHYIFRTGVNEKILEKYYMAFSIFIGMIFILACIISLFLEIEYNIGTTYNYLGDCVLAVYVSSVIIFISLIILIGNKMKIDKSQKYCYLIIIISFLLYFAFQFIVGIDLNAQSFIVSMLTISLYFNVESQDTISILNLNKINSVYELSNKTSTDIILNLSSYINNSTSRIIGITNLIKESNIDNNLNIENINENIETLINVSDKINKYSKLKLNEIILKNSIYDKNTIINKFNELNNLYLNKNVSIKYNINENFPNNINGDFKLFIDIIDTIIDCTLKNIEYLNLNIDISYVINNNKLIFNVSCNSNVYYKNILDNNDIYSFIINNLLTLFNSNMTTDTNNKLLNYSISFDII